MTEQIQTAISEQKRRQDAMAVCAEAQAGELSSILDALAPLPVAHDVRPAEVGLIMLRARMGGDGAPFNCGEATVTRATIALADGVMGFAYHLGRNRAKARAAATIDALWQGVRRDEVEALLQPVRDRIASVREREARLTAATRVDFFTMAGE